MTLVERLRLASEERGVDGITAPLLREAAARIEELKRQLRIARRVIEKLDGEGGQKQVRIRALEARIEELEQAHTVDNGFDITEGLHEAREAVLAGRARIAALQDALRAIVEDAFETDGADPDGGSQSLVATDLLERAQSLLAQTDTASQGHSVKENET